MRTVLLVLLTISLTTLSFSAAADETRPGCEASQTDPDGDAETKDRVSDRSTVTRDNVNRGTGACEGEHWDGQDSTGSTETGTGVFVLDPNGRIDRVGVYVNSGPSPSTPNIQQNGPTDAVHLRVVGLGSPGWKEGNYNVGDGTLYAMVEIWGVGSTGASARGHQDLVPCVAQGMALCAPNPGPGADGALIGSAEVAWYGRDNTDQSTRFAGVDDDYDLAYNTVHDLAFPTHGGHGPGGNVLASIVHFPHITVGQNVGEEGSCSQESYVGQSCTRDNTAITIELLA